MVGGRASFTVYSSGLAIGPGTELLATAQSGPGHDPGAEGKQAPGLWPGVGCRLGVDDAERHHAFFLALGKDLTPSLSLTASWPRSHRSSRPAHRRRASMHPRPGGCRRDGHRSMVACRFDQRWVTPLIHHCRWFAHRLRTQHGPRVRSRPVADASGAPVLRDQGPIGRPSTARPIPASAGFPRLPEWSVSDWVQLTERSAA